MALAFRKTAVFLVSLVLISACNGHKKNPPPTSSVDTPISIAGNDTVIDVGSDALVLDGSLSSDPNNKSLSYQWSVSTIKGDADLTISEADQQKATIQPSNAGEYLVKLVVNNGSSTNESSFTLVINGPPQVSAGEDLILNLGDLQIQLQSTVSDPNDDPLTFEWKLLSPTQLGSAQILSADEASTILQVDPSNTEPYELELTVSDGRLSSSDKVLVNINQFPLISEFQLSDANGNIGPDDSPSIDFSIHQLPPFAQLDVNVIASDPDPLDQLSYSWEIVRQPINANAVITDADTAIAKLLPAGNGQYELKVTVSDGMAQAVQSVVIDVFNQAPSVTTSNQSIDGIQPIAISATALDLDGDPINFLWEFVNIPLDSQINTITNSDQANASFTPDVLGIYRFKVTASDTADSDFAELQVNVFDSTFQVELDADASTAALEKYIQVSAGQVVQLLALKKIGQQTQAETYSWTLNNNPLAVTTPNLDTQAPNVIASFTYQVTMSEGGRTATDSIEINVLEDSANAFFVSTSGNDSTGDGSPTNPFASISHTIDTLTSLGITVPSGIYVAGGRYSENIALISNVHIFGGYTHNADGSVWRRTNSRTQVNGTDPIKGTNVIDVSIDGMEIVAVQKPLNSKGELSSYAVRLSGASDIQITNNIISAANGLAGADGGNGLAASPGSSGTRGSTACFDYQLAIKPANICESITDAELKLIGIPRCGRYTAGVGGTDFNPADDNTVNARGGNGGVGGGVVIKQAPGETAPLNGGVGGLAGKNTSINGLGKTGTAGRNGSIAGRLTSAGVVFSTSEASDGSNALGGGGGAGAAPGSLSFVTATGSPSCVIRGPAGSGGSGGSQGGHHGTSATSGGSSFGIYLGSSTNYTISGNTIIVGIGGNGGNGGNGSSGGLRSGVAGRPPVKFTKKLSLRGALVSVAAIAPPSGGGGSSRGGSGGHGAGGHGGVSINVAIEAAAQADLDIISKLNKLVNPVIETNTIPTGGSSLGNPGLPGQGIYVFSFTTLSVIRPPPQLIVINSSAN